MYKGIIYKYTSPSGKCYIGQTKHEKERRKAFLNENKDYSGPRINNARLKYGPRNFEYEIIFRVESLIESEVNELLNLKEMQYIKLFDSFENGYNSNSGGTGDCDYKITDETRQKLSIAATEYYKTHKSEVIREILQFDMEGNFITEWESAAKAAKSLNKEGCTITNVCSGKRNHAHGYIWRYRDAFEEIPNKLKLESKKNSPVPVYQYTLEGEFVKKWNNMKLAAEELGYSLGNFGTYCNGRNNNCYKGYKYYRGEME